MTHHVGRLICLSSSARAVTCVCVSGVRAACEHQGVCVHFEACVATKGKRIEQKFSTLHFGREEQG